MFEALAEPDRKPRAQFRGVALAGEPMAAAFGHRAQVDGPIRL